LPYVRTHGNQIAIVHGERDKVTGKVQQRPLFTFYSKKEAAAAIGDGSSEDSRYFEQLLSRANAQLVFDWPELRREIRRHLEVLPDIYPLRKAHGEQSFEKALFEFVRQLVICDPANSKVGRETLKKHAAELSTIQTILSLHQETISTFVERDESPFDLDDRFCWRYEIQSHTVPIGMEEFAENLYREGNYTEAKPLFELLTRCFPEYAEGYNYLGLIALNENLAKEAVECFRNTVKYGRTLFPRRVAKSDYWRDLETRPYLRGLMNLALALNMAGQFKETLSVCEKLIQECGPVGEQAAWAHKAAAYLNLHNWEDASDAALKIAKFVPDEGFVLGYAFFEMARYQECLQWFLHASLNSPHAAHILLGKSKPKPKESTEIEDHNGGITLVRSLPRFFQMQSKASTKFFKKFIENERVKALLADVMNCGRQHFDREKSTRENLQHWNELRSLAFASKIAKQLVKELGESKAGPSSSTGRAKRAD
jgi:tetratricopeptide (TPR) repeat protein